MKHCPFCHSINVGVIRRSEMPYVSCTDCGARGPYSIAGSPDEAKRLWEERSNLAHKDIYALWSGKLPVGSSIIATWAGLPIETVQTIVKRYEQVKK